MRIVAIFVLLLSPGTFAFAWEAPLGIPAPAFGIEDTHAIYSGRPGYKDAGNGPYTHYVDNSTSCTDNDNPFGSTDNPRCSIPTPVPAGSVVEIHGGPYLGDNLLLELNGTAEEPVFVRGTGPDTKPRFSGRDIRIRGSYAIIEYIDAVDGCAVLITSGDHVAFRNSHVHDHPGKGSLVGVTDGSIQIVIYNNEIDHNGDIPSRVDRHGVWAGRNTDGIWIVDNHIHHNSGDAIQFCHQCIGNGNGPANVFIGRNDMHDDEENAIDVKEFIGPVIVSENRIRNYRRSQDSNGDAIRINDEGDQGDIWIIYNSVQDSRLGIEPSGADATVYVIGNVITDIATHAIGADADYVINNTIVDARAAILDGEAKGNIVMNSRTAIGDDVRDCSHNLFENARRQGWCSKSVDGDPQLIVSGDGDVVGIESTSPAIGAGIDDHEVFDKFQKQFGIDIRVDKNGNRRPLGAAWSAGAHENPADLHQDPSARAAIER